MNRRASTVCKGAVQTLQIGFGKNNPIIQPLVPFGDPPAEWPLVLGTIDDAFEDSLRVSLTGELAPYVLLEWCDVGKGGTLTPRPAKWANVSIRIRLEHAEALGTILLNSASWARRAWATKWGQR